MFNIRVVRDPRYSILSRSQYSNLYMSTAMRRIGRGLGAATRACSRKSYRTGKSNGKDHGLVLSSSASRGGVVEVGGLEGSATGELIEFPHSTAVGIVADLSPGRTIAMVDRIVNAGEPVSPTGRPVTVPVGSAIVGRVLNPLGLPTDGEGN